MFWGLRSDLLNPKQAKSDADVMYDVEKWMDEHRALQALGEDKLPPAYQTTAILKIATPTVRMELEREERDMRMKGWDKDTVAQKMTDATSIVASTTGAGVPRDRSRRRGRRRSRRSCGCGCCSGSTATVAGGVAAPPPQ